MTAVAVTIVGAAIPVPLIPAADALPRSPPHALHTHTHTHTHTRTTQWVPWMQWVQCRPVLSGVDVAAGIRTRAARGSDGTGGAAATRGLQTTTRRWRQKRGGGVAFARWRRERRGSGR